jgi:hypothetical protein
MLPAGEEQAFREFFTAMSGVQPPVSVAWALGRFEIGCAQPSDATALSDYLLALRGLLDAMSETGQASLGLRLAALCAEEGTRREVQDRLEAALALERFVMGGSGVLDIEAESPRELVDELEGHVRALLRDVLCGYLDADLKAVADDILLESGELHLEIEARDLRKDPEPDDFEPEPEDFEPEPEECEPQEPPIPRFEREPVTFEPELEWEEEAEHDTAEIEPVSVATEPVQHQLDGVTESADWGWDDPEDFSAPV